MRSREVVIVVQGMGPHREAADVCTVGKIHWKRWSAVLVFQAFLQSGDKSPIRFFEAPADVLEDRATLEAWARKALDVARRHAERRR